MAENAQQTPKASVPNPDKPSPFRADSAMKETPKVSVPHDAEPEVKLHAPTPNSEVTPIQRNHRAG